MLLIVLVWHLIKTLDSMLGFPLICRSIYTRLFQPSSFSLTEQHASAKQAKYNFEDVDRWSLNTSRCMYSSVTRVWLYCGNILFCSKALLRRFFSLMPFSWSADNSSQKSRGDRESTNDIINHRRLPAAVPSYGPFSWASTSAQLMYSSCRAIPLLHAVH